MIIKREQIKDFNLDQIFDCGQCFRWEKEEDGSYTGIAFNRPVNVNFKLYIPEGCEGQLLFDNVDAEEFKRVWHPYLDLDNDYSDIKATLSANNEIMAEAIKSGEGIRILRQETWETLISFLVSQNNNIPRIKKCIEGLCENFGEPLGEYRGKQRFGFPTAEILARLQEEDLASIKLGYRAKYIIATAKKVVVDSIDLEQLREENTEVGYDYLTSLCGVGPKVANCILLFGLRKHETFPIDVWVKRVMNRLYRIEETDLKGMENYAAENFGKYGGIAQQYLFYHIRQIGNIE